MHRLRCKADGGYTLAEVVIAIFLVGTLVLALFGAFSSGLTAVEAARENLRATQILMQKMENIRLLTWNQLTNTTLAPASFTEYYDPLSTNSGVAFTGSYALTLAPTEVLSAYRQDTAKATITVFWTNTTGNRIPRVESRSMTTLVAHYGVHSYVFQ